MKCCIVGIIIFLSVICVSSISVSEGDSESLKLVHVLFRHGDRTNGNNVLYPNDPYKNETYSPYGWEQLTNKGKQREYKIGKALRKRYTRFLGGSFRPDILEAWSSDTDRTKSSLLLVLAGLFPPCGERIWEEDIPWQPIPYNTKPRDIDQLFFGMLCPNYKKLYKEYEESPKIVNEFKKHKEIFEYTSEHSGWNISSFERLLYLYLGLKVEDEWCLQLPQWTEQIWPDKLREYAIMQYSIYTGTTQLKQMTAGYLLKKIIEDSKSKIYETSLNGGQKLFLYAGHELNLAFMLKTLDIFQPHIPPYGSYIIFELHKINDEYGIKIFYQNYTAGEPLLLKLPACEDFCEINKFILLLEEFIPTDDLCGNEKIK